MDGGCAQRPHFVQHDRHAAGRELPRGLATGETAADDVNGLLLCRCHEQYLAHGPAKWEPVIDGAERRNAVPVCLCGGAWLAGLAMGTGPAAAIEMSPTIAQMYTSVEMLPPTASRMTVCYGFVCRLRIHPRFHAGDRRALDRHAEQGQGFARGRAQGGSAGGAAGWTAGWVRSSARRKRVARADFRHRDDDHNYDCYDTTRNASACCWCCGSGACCATTPSGTREYRGRFLFGQTPHNTAVLKDRTSGTKWVVDLWTKAYGELPDVMTVEKWLDGELGP